MTRKIKLTGLVLSILLVFGHSLSAQEQVQGPPADISDRMVIMFFLPYEKWNEGFHLLADEWERSHIPMAIEMLSLSRGEMAYRWAGLLAGPKQARITTHPSSG